MQKGSRSLRLPSAAIAEYELLQTEQWVQGFGLTCYQCLDPASDDPTTYTTGYLLLDWAVRTKTLVRVQRLSISLLCPVCFQRRNCVGHVYSTHAVVHIWYGIVQILCLLQHRLAPVLVECTHDLWLTQLVMRGNQIAYSSVGSTSESAWAAFATMVVSFRTQQLTVVCCNSQIWDLMC